MDISKEKEFSKKIGVDKIYSEQISLFFSPLPYKELPELFNNKHSFYTKGKKLYEYKVPYSNLPNDILFHVVETPAITKFLHMSEKKLDLDNDDIFYSYMKDKINLTKKLGYYNKGVHNLEEIAKDFLDIKKYFIKATAKNPNYKQYAAEVPHVMIYPDSGVINYESYKHIILGETPDTAAIEKLKLW